MSDETMVNGVPYQTYIYKKLREIFDPKDKLTLEIGSDAELIFCRHLVDDGARRVIASNQEGWVSSLSREGIPENIEFAAVDARKTDFDDNTFDLITGIALLEHINNCTAFRDEMLRILKPGGIAFFQGGAFYPCWQGHHVCLFDPDYHFWDKTNPFQPWEHLLYDQHQLTEQFLQRGIPEEDCKEIIAQVYESDLINRRSATYLIDILNGDESSKLFYKRNLLYEFSLGKKLKDTITARHGLSVLDLYTYAAQTVLVKNGKGKAVYSALGKQDFLDADNRESAETALNRLLQSSVFGWLLAVSPRKVRWFLARILERFCARARFSPSS